MKINIEKLAHEEATKAAQRDRSDPFIYNRVYTHFLNGVNPNSPHCPAYPNRSTTNRYAN